MCGRFSLAATPPQLQEVIDELVVDDGVEAHYNIAPSQEAYVVTGDEPHRLQRYRWGLIPFWSKAKPTGNLLINARSEGIEDKPAFRTPVRKHRCLVPADSFYEWRKVGRHKVPYRVQLRSHRLMVMAGIWDEWQSEAGPVRTFSVITTQPNAEMEPLHDRMPVLLLTAADRQAWLHAAGLPEALSLLHPPPDGVLEIYRVPEALNIPSHDHPGLHRKVEETPGLFGDLFGM